MSKVLNKIREIKNINEILCAIIMFNNSLIFITQNLISASVYNLLFKFIVAICILLSFIVNRWKIIKKSDIIIAVITIIMFLIDYVFRRNSLTIDIYMDFVKLCMIPCYFFTRVTDYRKLIKYLSNLAKIILVVYVFDALFNYAFTNDYMSYGFAMVLPAFFAIYLNYLYERKKIDLVYLLICFIGIFVYSNRTCLLSVIFLLIFTSRQLFSKKIAMKDICNKAFLKKTTIVILIFAGSFVLHYTYHNYGKIIEFISPKKEEIKDIVPTSTPIESNTPLESSKPIETSTPKPVETPKPATPSPTDNGVDVTFDSYAINKYSQGFNMKSLFSGRLEIYEKAFNVIKTEIVTSPVPLLFGKGSGYFRSINDNVYSHCIILDLIMEYGIVGLIIMLSLLIYCIYKLMKSKKDTEFYLMGCMFLFIAFPKLLLSTVFQKEYCLWLFIVLILCKYPIKINRKKEK